MIFHAHAHFTTTVAVVIIARIHRSGLVFLMRVSVDNLNRHHTASLMKGGGGRREETRLQALHSAIYIAINRTAATIRRQIQHLHDRIPGSISSITISSRVRPNLVMFVPLFNVKAHVLLYFRARNWD
jgi:hypothetical protein